jgi:hypothetical protein
MIIQLIIECARGKDGEESQESQESQIGGQKDREKNSKKKYRRHRTEAQVKGLELTVNWRAQ